MSLEGKTKKITLGFVVSWILAVVVGIPGIMMLFEGLAVGGVLLILTALVLLPPVNSWVEKKFHLALSGVLKFVVVTILLIISGIAIASSKNGPSGASDQTAAQSIPAPTETGSTVAAPSQPTQAQAQAPASPQVLLSISGSGSKTTEKFTAVSDWDLNWSYDCSNFGDQGNFQVFVYNGDGSMSFSNSGVNQLGKSGADVEHYHTGGTFYLTVNSECGWKIEVKG